LDSHELNVEIELGNAVVVLELGLDELFREFRTDAGDDY